MPLLATQAILAPTGMDADSDPEILELNRSQYLQNALCDKKGLLRTNIQVTDLLPDDWPDPIDAVAYYYAEHPEDDQFIFVSGGQLYYASVTPGHPVPAAGAFTAAGGLAAPFTPGVGVRFVAFGHELVALPEEGVLAARPSH